MKKIVIAILAAAVCLAVSACSKPNQDQPSAPVQSVSDIAVSEDDTVPENPLRITLSGNPEDTFIADKDCYAEGENVIIYFQKNVPLRGDMIVIAERIMKDISSSTNMSFDRSYSEEYPFFPIDSYFDADIFSDVNPDHKKVSIIVPYAPDKDSTVHPYAYDDGAVVDVTDFNFDEHYSQALYHELAHVIHTRNGVSLAPNLTEGFAAYMEDKAQRAAGYPSWDAIQYFSGLLFDESLIADGEKGFSVMYDSTDYNYQYGFRFMTFLFDVYGEDVFNNILKEATVQKFDSGYDPENKDESIMNDTEHMKQILRSATSDDVFEKFTQWYNSEWSTKTADYYAHLTALGLW